MSDDSSDVPRAAEPDEYRAALCAVFESVGFSMVDADIMATRWPRENIQEAAYSATGLRDLGLPPFLMASWRHAGLELECTHLTEVWVDCGWSPGQVTSLAWACDQTTGWNNLSMWGWAACATYARLTPRRAVGYAAAWFQPHEVIDLEVSDDPPSDGTLRMMAALRNDFPFPGMC